MRIICIYTKNKLQPVKHILYTKDQSIPPLELFERIHASIQCKAFLSKGWKLSKYSTEGNLWTPPNSLPASSPSQPGTTHTPTHPAPNPTSGDK